MIKPYWSDGKRTVYCGDCREILPEIEPVDLVLTDPPYGINHSSGHGASWQHSEIANDSDTSLRDWIISYAMPMPMAIFGSWKTPKPALIRQVLIWDKGPAFGMGDLSFPWKNSFEEIYILGTGWQGKRDEAVLRGHLVVSWESKGRCHPNEKPVSLLRYLISKLPSASLICDPCCGSGTTLRAAKDLGLSAIGIEISEEYCRIAVERLRQSSLFDDLPEPDAPDESPVLFVE